MKHAPSTHSIRNTTKNQNTSICYSEKQEIRRQAIETAEKSKTLPHLISKPIIYDINRKP